MKKRRIAFGRIFVFIILPIMLIIGISKLIWLKKVYDGEIIANVPDPSEYPVMGVDVSRYQGNINWDTMAAQDVTFAFIKATEGSSHTDPLFDYNWKESQRSGVYAGAYHFFSFESSGETQAQNFIEAVGTLDGALPPVVDLEFYGDYTQSPLPKKETREILDGLLDTLENYYGVKPIIYTTTRAYYSYILGGGYGDYPLWMRDTYMEPLVQWTFWQYSDKGSLKGYDGEQADHTEMYIDMNVYHGTLEELVEEFSLLPREENAE